MIPGIDPRIDIAFKKLFGTPEWRDLTMSLIDAVLQPPRFGELAELELLNPYTDKMSVDDKLSILDIRARDGDGRQFNIEMQMIPRVSLRERILYYWSKLYAQQLVPGDNYEQLKPTISICFVNGVLFPGSNTYYRRFQLRDNQDGTVFSDDIVFYVMELTKFDVELRALRDPLDLWLYFLNNGQELDADALPAPLATGPFQRAMEILKMFSQNEMERELYEGRLKARRDAETTEALYNHEVKRRKQLEEQLTSAVADTKTALAKRVQLCQRLIGLVVTDQRELMQMELANLQQTADELEARLAPRE